nr:Efflux transporter, RND family, MFP subunit [Methylocystis sp. SC2]
MTPRLAKQPRIGWRAGGDRGRQDRPFLHLLKVSWSRETVEAGHRIGAGADTPLFLVATDLANVRVAIEVGKKDAGEIEVRDSAVEGLPS